MVRAGLIIAGLLSLLISCNNSESVKQDREQKDSLSRLSIDTVPGQAAEKDLKLESYCNHKFYYCIDYPVELLYPEGEAENGDGQAFKSADGSTLLLVYRDFRDNMYPENTFTIETAFKEDLKSHSKPPKTISYKTCTNDFFVISGHNNGKIFYQKTILADGQLVTSILEYNDNEKEIYNAVAERIFKSFK